MCPISFYPYAIFIFVTEKLALSFISERRLGHDYYGRYKFWLVILFADSLILIYSVNHEDCSLMIFSFAVLLLYAVDLLFNVSKHSHN